jgi:glucosylceramidase
MFAALLAFSMSHLGCKQQEKVQEETLDHRVFQTAASGDQLKELKPVSGLEEVDCVIVLDTNQTYQSITGIGGAFTESSATLFFSLPDSIQEAVIQRYFGPEGARYSLTRTHMNSCDFSLGSYSYAPVPGDTLLEHFSLDEDRNDIIPMIKRAQGVSEDGFRLIASPWTAPPWMKDNNAWFGGKLLKEHYPTWARFFARYAQEMKAEGIDVWAFTVENEPLGNDANWESMHYTPEETADFVVNHLGPTLQEAGVESKILVYDQNRDEEMHHWVSVLLKDPEVLTYIYGTAVHWYSYTNDWVPEELQYAHDLAPEKHLIHTEACVDAEVPHWRDDAWYWKREATDWGWDWASEEKKKDHPKYVPVYRYAQDIIGCLNNWVEGWVDWNMILDRQGGPNHVKNWCVAPVLADTNSGEVYYTPLYYVMSHFSRFMRPGAERIHWTCSDAELMTTSVQNPDGSIAVILLNKQEQERRVELRLNGQKIQTILAPQSIQTVHLTASTP